jgi:hypothetical protein
MPKASCNQGGSDSFLAKPMCVFEMNLGSLGIVGSEEERDACRHNIKFTRISYNLFCYISSKIL